MKPTKTIFNAVCVALFLTNALPTGKTLAQSDRPNILYFYVDDMGWGSIGPNAQAERRAKGLPYVRTPNLDELARQGVNFTRGYGCFVCSPARSSQQTGFHQGHTFADRNDPDNAKKAIRRDDITMGDALSAAGYVTGYWGKWGYGGSKAQVDPVIDNVQTLPTSHGYQHVLAELHHVRAHTFFQPTLWKAPAPKDAIGGIELAPNRLTRYQNNDAYPNTPANQNHANYPATAYCDDTYAFAALDFVREQSQNYKRNGQPFFGLFAAQIPHAPFDEIAKLPGWNDSYVDDPHFASLPKQSQQWAAMVSRIDGHFGNILAALEDPNNDGDKSDSVVKDTLVIFQSDNGGPAGSNNASFDANGGLSGSKGKIQEGGIRVPLIMRWPEKITAGSTIDSPVDVTDLLPTFCELAGAAVPLGIDGVSIAPTLTGKGNQLTREFLIHEATNGQSIIRGNYKLVRPQSKQKKNLITGAPKLYDLSKDPTESQDIAAANKELTKELLQLLQGERVAEPKGFANTYHEWTGPEGGETSNANNWTDYKYSNAGITYTTDAGPPQLSWVARMHNEGDSVAEAKADHDLEFLALSVGGKTAVQRLVLGNTSLTARNELRIADHGEIALGGGSIHSLRWVSIAPSAELSGHGEINGDIINRGTITATKPLTITGDLTTESGSKLNLGSQLNIDGVATLGGTLIVDGASTKGNQASLLSAKRVVGRFSELKIPDGWRVSYTETSVVLSQKQ